MTSKGSIKLLKRYGNDQIDVMELYKIIENELDDLKHNYKAVKELYDNVVAIAIRIQNKRDKLKRDIARYFELKVITRKEPHEIEEFDDLEDKLSKVGKEE